MAQSDVCQTGGQVTGSIPVGFGNIPPCRLIMKDSVWQHFSLQIDLEIFSTDILSFQVIYEGDCQFLVKDCVQECVQEKCD